MNLNYFTDYRLHYFLSLRESNLNEDFKTYFFLNLLLLENQVRFHFGFFFPMVMSLVWISANLAVSESLGLFNVNC